MKTILAMKALLTLTLLAYPDTGQKSPPPARDHLWAYNCANCNPCHRGNKAIEKDGRYDLHVVTCNKKNPPPKWLKAYPSYVWRGKGGKAYYAEGFTDFETLNKQIESTLK